MLPLPHITHAAADASIQKQFGMARSPLWDETRKNYLAANPKCAVCGDTSNVEVHHKFPFHYVVTLGRPDLELDERNFITLCEDTIHGHHLLIGHLDDWKSYDYPAQPDRLDAFVTKFKSKDQTFIRSDTAFKTAEAAKPPHLDKMTAAQKAAFKQLLDQTIPANAALTQKAVDARKGL